MFDHRVPEGVRREASRARTERKLIGAELSGNDTRYVGDWFVRTVVDNATGICTQTVGRKDQNHIPFVFRIFRVLFWF